MTIPTTNTLQRTFLIRNGDSTGTAFAVELEGKEYLVTARHMFSDQSSSPFVLREEVWKPLPITGIYGHSGEPDIAIITLDRQIAPRHPVQLTTKGTTVGQSVAMLGFPFGWRFSQFNLNNGYPLPFIKAAVLSAILTKDQTSVVYLDGHNNPGFSGGPIVADEASPPRPGATPKIIGVVSGFPPEGTPHPDQIDPPPKEINGYPIAYDHVHLTNSGFIKAYDIRHVKEVIEANPHGFHMTQ